MNRLLPPLLFLLAYIISACAPPSQQYTDLETRSIDAAGAQSILIQVDHGEVTILESPNQKIMMEGQVLLADTLEYTTNSDKEQVVIKVFTHQQFRSNVPLRATVHVPSQLQVKVETDSASVIVQRYAGDVEIASTSGNIRLEQVRGRITLRSNRGDISVRDGSGIASIVGNYGALTVKNVQGDIAVSTIMGNVMFSGLIGKNDTVHLETDHGAVAVDLEADSALTLQVRSTSGDVSCMLPEIASTTRTCDGAIQSGGGSLAIRTVSGAVTLRLLP